MNRLKTICWVLVIAPTIVVSTQARAASKCDAPQTHIDRAACEKAAESPQALRQYIQRMRMIDSLLFSDYVNEARASAWAQNESNRAADKKESVQTADFLPENVGV